jgi:hypothetical protein
MTANRVSKLAKLAIRALIVLGFSLIAPELLFAQSNASVRVSAEVISGPGPVSASVVAETAEMYLTRSAASTSGVSSIAVGAVAQVRAEQPVTGAERRSLMTRVVLEYAAN